MNEPIVGSKRAHSPRSVPAKRAKAAQACLSCRKHKTRCEMLDGDNSGTQCHRCKVLGLSCSFEDGSVQSSGPSSARNQQSECAVQPHIDRRSSIELPKKPQDASVDDARRHHKAWGNTFSDALPPFRALPRDVEEVELLHPERLLPEQHSPWGFLKLPGGFESTMVPILAIQALTRSGTNTPDPSWTKVDQTLLHILGREQVKYLVDIFEERYSPWLNLQPGNRGDGPLLRLAQCCVASRHLEPSIRSIVAPQLYRLADEVVFKQSFNPLPSTDVIHATLILSLWEPVDDTTPKEPRDGRLIAATAVSMAMNLRLSEAMVYAQTLRNQKKPNEPPSAELVEALDKARLWFALNTVESMLCAGTGREPISDCRSMVYEALETTSFATIGSTRDLRLCLFCQLLATTRTGLSIRLRTSDELGVFYKEVLDFLGHMDVIERLISPLPVLAEHEIFYFHMLQVYYQSCRLLVLVHALMQAKIALGKTSTQGTWFLSAEHNGVNLAQSWGHQALVLSEAILIATISRSELALMSTAPDSLFSMITLATIFVLLSKWNVLENIGQQMPGSSDSILAKIIERLSLIACSPDHFAAKCARLIEAGVLSFRRRSERSEPEPKVFSRPVVRHFTEYGPSRRGSVSNGMDTGGYAAGSSTTGVNTGGCLPPGPVEPQYTLPNLPMSDPNYFVNSDIFFDNDFWSTFMSSGT
ncbi:hypothetical protein L210DRAFT_3387413 [Boletus edulis BED1]|uniref:Zn(2)-C6 fungal-type domain-containing protein n=1 Tax=Boletus edulis BED1 TaxID=1328754 RepID=A0AAD4C655_BOLED|nr:hypothetical protein L210DRAFT_3387413 [Boletus edulis BED1]